MDLMGDQRPDLKTSAEIARAEAEDPLVRTGVVAGNFKYGEQTIKAVKSKTMFLYEHVNEVWYKAGK